jgi:hypothetical protein
MSDEDLLHAIAQSRPPASCTPPEIARILVKESWEDALGHEISDRKVSVRGTQVLPKAGSALPEGSIGIRPLGFACEYKSEGESPPIPGILPSYLEFLTGCNRLVVLKTGRRPEIGNNKEDVSARGRIVIPGSLPCLLAELFRPMDLADKERHMQQESTGWRRTGSDEA